MEDNIEIIWRSESKTIKPKERFVIKYRNLRPPMDSGNEKRENS